MTHYPNLSLVPQGQAWHVVTKSRRHVVAEIHHDEYRVLHAVVFCRGIGSADRTAILQLAVNYVQHFLNAEYGSCDLSRPYRRHVNKKGIDTPFDESESVALMDFGRIPAGFYTEDRFLLSALQNGRVQIFNNIKVTAEEAVHSVIRGLRFFGVIHKFTDVPSWVRPNDNLACEVSVENPYSFTFWNELFDVPEPGSEEFGQYIIPMSHPRAQGANSRFLINGSTSAMWSTATPIRWVSSPLEARVVLPDESTSDGHESWLHLKHPFKAEGKRFCFVVNRLKVRTESGQGELTAFIKAALGLNGKYLSVLGGFKSPLCSPSTRLRELGHRSYLELGHKRATANHCVWVYNTLVAEGELDEAFIPPWFEQERWLEIYEGAQVRHGID